VKRLVLIRHGETEWSASGRHTSRTDVPLTARGEELAGALGLRLGQLGIRPTVRLSSPRQRAVATAHLAGLGEGLVTDERLRELDYGDYEGRTTVDIRAQRPTWNLFRDASPGGETLAEAGARADDLLASLAPEEGEGDVALVGHGHFSRILAARYLGLDAPWAHCLGLGTASISLLGHEHEWRAITLWNDQPRPR
jgi:broad specificity phosphatase PhoE